MESRWIRAQISAESNTCSADVKITDGNWGFMHPMFDKLRRRQLDQDEYVANPYEAEEGVVTCGNCRSKRVVSYSVQSRSSDEPMSTYSCCTECNKTWLNCS